MSTRPIVAIALMAATVAVPAGVSARPRHRFEPTDLEWEATGVFELDIELGAVRSPNAGRLLVPDFELDIGILDNVEFDIDGSYALESSSGAFTFDHAVVGSLWPSLKIGVWDDHDYETQRAQAFGIQFGPRIPLASGAHGLGGEALVVWGGSRRGLTVALNFGGFVEPPPDAVSQYFLGLEGGVDLELALDQHDRLQLLGELAGAYFFTSDPSQLHTTAGLNWTVNANLNLSVVGLFGFLPGDDRYGILFGFEPKLRLFEPPPRVKEGS
jgi:hypothetical protein